MDPYTHAVGGLIGWSLSFLKGYMVIFILGYRENSRIYSEQIKRPPTCFMLHMHLSKNRGLTQVHTLQHTIVVMCKCPHNGTLNPQPRTLNPEP